MSIQPRSISPNILAEEIGARLKQARLNADLSQEEVARNAGLSRKTVINAEKGQVTLEKLAAIMMALNLTDDLDKFIPKQELSPIQLSKLEGRKRKRASGKTHLEKSRGGDW